MKIALITNYTAERVFFLMKNVLALRFTTYLALLNCLYCTHIVIHNIIEERMPNSRFSIRFTWLIPNAL